MKHHEPNWTYHKEPSSHQGNHVSSMKPTTPKVQSSKWWEGAYWAVAFSNLFSKKPPADTVSSDFSPLDYSPPDYSSPDVF